MLHEKKCSSNDACNVHFNSLSSFPAPSQPSLLLPECKPMFASDIAYAGNIEILKSDCFSSSSFFIPPPRLATAAATAVAQIFFLFPNIFVLLHRPPYHDGSVISVNYELSYHC